MTEPVKEVQIQCLYCKKWFHSPISFGEFETFDTSTLDGNTVSCPHCRKMTGCNKENIRVHTKNGKAGFVGVETHK